MQNEVTTLMEELRPFMWIWVGYGKELPLEFHVSLAHFSNTFTLEFWLLIVFQK